MLLQLVEQLQLKLSAPTPPSTQHQSSIKERRSPTAVLAIRQDAPQNTPNATPDSLEKALKMALSATQLP